MVQGTEAQVEDFLQIDAFIISSINHILWWLRNQK